MYVPKNHKSMSQRVERTPPSLVVSSNCDIESPDPVSPTAQSSISPRDHRLERFGQGAEKLKECEPYPVAWLDLKVGNAFDIDYVDCNCWKCKRCGPRKKEQWWVKLNKRLANEEYIEYLYLEKAKWHTWRKALERLGKQYKYCKMKQMDNLYLIITTGKMGGQEVPRMFRGEFLIQALERVPFISRPISTSRNWDPKKRITSSIEDPKRQRIDSCYPYPPEEMKTLIDEEFADKGVTTTIEQPMNRPGMQRIRIAIPASMLKPPGKLRDNSSMLEVIWHTGALIRSKWERKLSTRLTIQDIEILEKGGCLGETGGSC